MSYYSGGWSLVVIGLLELVVFSWVYGTAESFLFSKMTLIFNNLTF